VEVDIDRYRRTYVALLSRRGPGTVRILNAYWE
jgi:hypothetical protein